MYFNSHVFKHNFNLLYVLPNSFPVLRLVTEEMRNILKFSNHFFFWDVEKYWKLLFHYVAPALCQY